MNCSLSRQVAKKRRELSSGVYCQLKPQLRVQLFPHIAKHRWLTCSEKYPPVMSLLFLFKSYLLSFTSFSPWCRQAGRILKASAEILSAFPLQQMIFCLKLPHHTHCFKRQNGLLLFYHLCSRYPILLRTLTFLAFRTEVLCTAAG